MSKNKKAPKSEQPKENAAIRLSRAEAKMDAIVNAIQAQQQSLSILSDEIDKLRELTLGVARRLNTAIQVAESGSLTMDSVNSAIVNQNVETLKSTVNNLVEEGLLGLKENGEIGDNDFVVAREVSLEDGKVVNPRLQFAMASMTKEVVQKTLGKKVGDTLQSEGDTTKIEILEIYAVMDEKELELQKIKEELKEAN